MGHAEHLVAGQGRIVDRSQHLADLLDAQAADLPHHPDEAQPVDVHVGVGGLVGSGGLSLRRGVTTGTSRTRSVRSARLRLRTHG